MRMRNAAGHTQKTLTRSGFSLNRALFRKNVGALIRAGVRQLAACSLCSRAGVRAFVPGKF